MTPAEFPKWVKTILEAAKLRLQAVRVLEQLARDCVQAGDVPRFKGAIESSREPSKVPTQKEIDDNYAKFGNGDPALKKIVEQLRAINKDVAATLARIQNMKIQPVKATVKFQGFTVKAMAGIDPLFERTGPAMVQSRVKQDIDASSKLTTNTSNKSPQSFSLGGKLTLSSVTQTSVRGIFEVSSAAGSVRSELKLPVKNLENDTIQLIIKIADDAMAKLIPTLEK